VTLIVDASVAVKWLVKEGDSAAAKRLIAEEILAAPELLFIECANVLRTKQRFGDLTPELVREAFSVLDAVPVRSVPVRRHVAAAHAIAMELDRSVYDSLYLAVALSEHATLVTADEKFARAARAHPIYRDSIRSLDG
jgi:predicted nucleic acid-binding protein